MDPFDAINKRLADLERRMNAVARHGPVSEVNPEEGWVRLDFGEGTEGRFLSPRIPYAQMAGALKAHAPPSVGQQMTMFAPAGDLRQAVAMPFTWSADNPAPGTGGDPVLTYGDVRVTLTTGAVEISAGGFALKINGAGLAMSGGGVGHDGVEIGATHKHPGVMPGGAETEPPSGSGPTT